VAFDTRAAWTGAYPSAPQIPLRIEAAAWKGRLVSLAILGPWPRGDGTASTPTPPPTLAVALVFIFWAAGVVIALRNLRLGRSDLLGAVRLAVFVLIGALIAVVNVAHRAAVPSQAANIVAIAFFPRAVLAWILYMTIEPYVRRHWPQALIGWSRALAGRFRDPVVCGHILVGMAVGLVVSNIAVVDRAQAGIPLVTNFRSLYANSIGAWAALLTQSPLFALSLFFVFVLLRILLKRTWLAVAVVFIVLTSFFVFGPPGVPLASGEHVRTDADRCDAMGVARCGGQHGDARIDVPDTINCGLFGVVRNARIAGDRHDHGGRALVLLPCARRAEAAQDGAAGRLSGLSALGCRLRGA